MHSFFILAAKMFIAVSQSFNWYTQDEIKVIQWCGQNEILWGGVGRKEGREVHHGSRGNGISERTKHGATICYSSLGHLRQRGKSIGPEITLLYDVIDITSHHSVKSDYFFLFYPTINLGYKFPSHNLK